MIEEAEAERWAREIARAHHAKLSGVRWTDDHGGATRMTAEGVELALGRRILVDAGTMRFHIAHELGHVVLGHLRRRGGRLREVWPYLLAGGLVELAAMLAAAWWAWVVLLVPVVLVGILAVVARRVVLPLERAADQFAEEHGAPAREAQSLRQGHRLWAVVIKTHPTWEERSRRTG